MRTCALHRLITALVVAALIPLRRQRTRYSCRLRSGGARRADSGERRASDGRAPPGKFESSCSWPTPRWQWRTEGMPSVWAGDSAPDSSVTMSPRCARSRMRLRDEIRKLRGRELGRLSKLLNAVVVAIDASQVTALGQDGVPACLLSACFTTISWTCPRPSPTSEPRLFSASAWMALGCGSPFWTPGSITPTSSWEAPARLRRISRRTAPVTADARNTTTDGLFPTAKVVSGYDFIGELGRTAAGAGPGSDRLRSELWSSVRSRTRHPCRRHHRGQRRRLAPGRGARRFTCSGQSLRWDVACLQWTGGPAGHGVRARSGRRRGYLRRRGRDQHVVRIAVRSDSGRRLPKRHRSRPNWAWSLLRPPATAPTVRTSSARRPSRQRRSASRRRRCQPPR